MSNNTVSVTTKVNQAAQSVQKVRQLRDEINRSGTAAASASQKIAQGNMKVAQSSRFSNQAEKEAAHYKREAIRLSQVATRYTQRYGIAKRQAAAEAVRADNRIAQSTRRIIQLEHQLENAQRRRRWTGGGGGMAGSALGAFGGGFASAFTIGSGMMVAGAGIRALDEREALRRSFRYKYGESQGQLTFTQTRELADQLGMNVGEISGALRQLSDNLGPDKLLRTMKAFVAAGADASAEGISRALVQYVQVANTGKLEGDELKLMREQGVNIYKILANAGLADRIGSQSNQITFEELNDAVLKYGETSEAVKRLGEVSETGSASLARLENALTQDLLPAIGQEATPAVQALAREIPMIVKGGKILIENWEWVGGAIATGAAYMVIQKEREARASIRAAASLERLAMSADRASAGDLVGAGGGRGRGRGGKVPNRVPGSGHVKTYSPLGNNLRHAMGLAPLAPVAQPAYVGGAGLAGSAITAGGTALATGGLMLASIAAIEAASGIKSENSVFAQFENWRNGRGFVTDDQVVRYAGRAATDDPGYMAAKAKKEALERYYGIRMSRESYYLQTGDERILAGASEMALNRLRAQRAATIEDRDAQLAHNRAKNSTQGGRSPGMSPRRASIDRANAEAQERVTRGMAF